MDMKSSQKVVRRGWDSEIFGEMKKANPKSIWISLPINCVLSSCLLIAP